MKITRRRTASRWTRHPEVRLDGTTPRVPADSPPRINHPNNRAVPPADSPKRASAAVSSRIVTLDFLPAYRVYR